MERRQLPSESADIFISEIIKLKNQMRIQLQEYEIVRMIKDNLKEGLIQLIYPKNVGTIEELLEECKRAERNIAKRISYRQQQQNYRRINELDIEGNLQSEHVGIEALNKVYTSGKQVICWNCRITGHSFIDCPLEQRNIFCYKCGFDGVTSPKCPRCSGNPIRNMLKTGPTCSEKETAQ